MSEAIDILVRKKAIENVNKAIKSVAELNAEIIKLSNNAADVPKQTVPEIPSKVITRQKEHSKFISEISAKNKEAQRQQNTLATATAKLNAIETQRGRAIAKTKLETQLKTKAQKEELLLSSKLVGAFQKLNIQRNQAASVLKNLIANERSSTAEIKKAQAEFDRLDSKLKKANAAVGNFSNNVGNYPRRLRGATRALRSFAGAFGFTSGIFLFAGALKSTLSIMKQFDQAQSDLAAILGRSKGEIGDLTIQAKELGATTAFTATQVSQLQLELAKLGFTDDQILKATLGVENLAIATGVDAARAAKLAGAALRGFNLDASESNRVASALAVSTTKSASSFETLEVSLPKVSAIAKSFGFTLEDTTALLGGLQNAGLEASTAGTSLRQIFLQLADSNGKLARRLGGGAKSFDELIGQFKKLEKEGIDLSEAFNLTNARSVAAFKIFLQGADDLKVLRDSIVDVEDELSILAETKLDSLTGDVTLLNSAWEGLVLSIEDGNGSISSFFRDATQGVTDLLAGINKINESPLDLGKKAAEQIVSDFKSGTENLTGDTKEFIVKTLQEADKNIQLLQDRLNETLDRGFFIDIRGNEVVGDVDVLKEIRESLEKEKSTRSELTKILIEEGNAKDDLVVKTAKLSFLVNSEKGREINLENQITAFRGLSTNQLNKLNKEYSDYLENIKKGKKVNESTGNPEEGTIAFYKKLISEEKKLQETRLKTREEVEKSEGVIKSYQKEIDRLTGSLEKLKKVKSEGVFGTTVEEAEKLSKGAKDFRDSIEGTELGNGETVKFGIEAIEAPDTSDFESDLLDKVKTLQEGIVDSTKLTAEQMKDIYGGIFDSFSQYYGLDLSLFETLLTTKVDSFEDVADEIGSFAKSLNDAITNSTLNAIDIEIEANQNKLDTILNSETASDEQKRIAQEKFDQQEKALRLEKAKAERDAALVSIAIDTAVGIGKAIAASPTTGGLPFSAIVAAIGAVQAGIVASQPLPQFYKGTENAPRGYAMTDERGAEMHLDRFGNIKDFGSDSGARMKFLEKGDVIKTASQTKNILSQPFNNDTTPKNISELNIVQVKTDEKAMEKAMSRAIRKSRFNVSTNVVLPKKVSWK